MLKQLKSGPYPDRNGDLTFVLDWKMGYRRLTIYGGPFRAFDKTADGAWGLNLKAEQPDPRADQYLPIRDYDVPEDAASARMAVLSVIEAAASGRKAYVGCAGGWGRTGLILALVAKTLGQEDPVGFVRQHYTPHAVETREQKAYVDKFDVEQMQRAVRATLKKGRWVRLWRSLAFGFDN